MDAPAVALVGAIVPTRRRPSEVARLGGRVLPCMAGRGWRWGGRRCQHRRLMGIMLLFIASRCLHVHVVLRRFGFGLCRAAAHGGGRRGTDAAAPGEGQRDGCGRPARRHMRSQCGRRGLAASTAIAACRAGGVVTRRRGAALLPPGASSTTVARCWPPSARQGPPRAPLSSTRSPGLAAPCLCCLPGRAAGRGRPAAAADLAAGSGLLTALLRRQLATKAVVERAAAATGAAVLERRPVVIGKVEVLACTVVPACAWLRWEVLHGCWGPRKRASCNHARR